MARLHFSKNWIVYLLGTFFSWVLLYSYARFQFVVWNRSSFEDLNALDFALIFLNGIQFDVLFVSHALLILLPGLLIPRHRITAPIFYGLIGVFVSVSVFVYVINMVDVEYVNFIGRRFTYSDLQVLGETEGKLMKYLGSYWWFGVFNIPILLAMIFYHFKFFYVDLKSSKPTPWFKYSGFAFLFLIALVIGIRGGFQTRPLGLAHGSRFPHRFTNFAVTNTGFTILRTQATKLIREDTFFANAADVYPLLNTTPTKSELLIEPRPKTNVVFIIMESMAQEYREFTPFLNGMEKQALSFPRGIANARRSLDAIPSLLASFPPLLDTTFIFSTYMTSEFQSLPSILNQEGYETAFFHGGNNGTMHFDDFAKRAGYQHYFGASEYPTSADNDGTWGIFDEPFMLFMGKELGKFKKPFYASFFSLSSHHPYTLPEKYKDLPSGPIPILKTIAYADQALKSFFEFAKTQDWYNNTLFIITADHTAVSYKKEFQNEPAGFWVPILFFHPKMNWPKALKPNLAQHIDIMPSIFDFLGLQCKPVNPLAKSVFRDGPRTAINYGSGHYFFFTEDGFGSWPKGAETPNVFSWSPPNNLMPGLPTEKGEQLQKQLKAQIQYFNTSMSRNQLVYENSCELGKNP